MENSEKKAIVKEELRLQILERVDDDQQAKTKELLDQLEEACQRPSYFEDVKAFHAKFKIGYDGPPRLLPADLQEFRRKRLHSEHVEYIKAVEENQADQILDGIVDLIYIGLGTIDLHGYNFDEAWRRVHEKNMQKIRAKSAKDSKWGHATDIIKPPGWTPPDLTDLVVDLGGAK